MKNLIAVLCWFIPSKKIRHNLRDKYVKSKRIKYGNNNKVIIHMPNGQTIVNPRRIHGLCVNFCGHDSYIELFYPLSFNNCVFNLIDDCNFVIKSTSIINNTVIEGYRKSVVIFDENLWIGGANIHMMNETGTTLKIGKNTALSYGVEIYTTDTHSILNMNGECINNKKSSVVIGEHCWICASCVLLKGARIPDNVILGHSAVCTGKIPESNCIYAGNPCRLVKKDVTWRGGIID